MTTIQHSEVINRPPAEVFAFAVDVTRWPLWRTGILEVEHTAGPQMGTGSRWRILGSLMGRQVAMMVEVSDYEPDRRVSFRSLSGPLQVRGTFTFEPEDGGTRLSVDAEVEAGGVLKLAGGLVSRQAHKIWEEDLATLKGILES